VQKPVSYISKNTLPLKQRPSQKEHIPASNGPVAKSFSPAEGLFNNLSAWGINDIETVRQQVNSWFGLEVLARAMGQAEDETAIISRDWLAKSGKRWRPLLVVCVYQALQGRQDSILPPGVRDIAIAVECFHKASLIHDDIEDGDKLRYGEKTLHEAYGVPIALNVGDFLLGEGYRMIAQVKVSGLITARMLRAASAGHRQLCLGQGAELSWMRQPKPLSSQEVIDIFCRKTSPAFTVALQLGAIYAGSGEELGRILSQYSQALGVAYQISDDLHDFIGVGRDNDLAALRPSLILALAYERAQGQDRSLLEAIWRRTQRLNDSPQKVAEIITRLKVPAAAEELIACYQAKAIASAAGIDKTEVKALLQRIVDKIFQDIAAQNRP